LRGTNINGEINRPRPRWNVGCEDKGRSKSKQAYLKNTRKIRQCNKMDVQKEIVQNSAKGHETCKSKKCK
jgi:hypothetical protein